MSGATGLALPDGRSLRRAEASDLESVTALQRAAYAHNRRLLGMDPLPLQVDYEEILRTLEVWLAEGAGGLEGVLILKLHGDHLLIWSIATAPAEQARGLGREMLAAAEERARQLGLTTLRLYTGAPLKHLIDWYGRHGYVLEQEEALPDRRIVHMVKQLPA